MNLFSTVYHIDGQRYETAFWAESVDDACRIAEERRMGEEINDYPVSYTPVLPSGLIRIWDFGNALHAACWLGMVACSSGHTKGFDLLNDRGLIHILAHLIRPEISEKPADDKIRMMVLLAYWRAIILEAIVPGFGGGDRVVPHTSKNVEDIFFTARRVADWAPMWYIDNCPEIPEFKDTLVEAGVRNMP